MCGCVREVERESRGEEGMKYSGVWKRSVLVCECVSV